ncbi:hypothetical protein BV20DRAFT_968964 [Pilatotrama ljubarskyi]|nr:hypothetical protein BV20DRAFT_968964 [Pilatotrama ljubarskyi]
MSESLPPAYPAGNFAVAPQLDISQPALPRYSPSTATIWDVPPPDQEHSFCLTAKKTGERWLTLSVMSRAASAAEPPTFYQGASIAGSLKLELDKKEFIDEISLALYGRLSIFSHSTANFFYMSKTVYSAAEKNSDAGSSPTPFLKRGRLKGRYEWPYSLRLPKGVSILSSITAHGATERENYRMPPSFSDEQSSVHVQYSLVVRVNRGGFKTGSKLTVPLTYIPLARPSPPTILRQLAYQEDHPLVGPDGDPDGWKALGPISVDGVLFKTMSVEAECKLHVSKPLTYARGGIIHLLISICCGNRQFLDLITPQSVRVALIQRLTFGDAPQTTRFSERLTTHTTVKTYERAFASWWRNSSESQGESTKTFAGELLVPDNLVPACQILHYGHGYELAFCTLSAVGFTPAVAQKKALLSVPVGIVTAFAQGPRPRPYRPPEYEVP